MEEQRIKLYIVPHSHIDMEWYWTMQDVRDRLPELFYDTLLPDMKEDPALTFAQDQACLWNLILEDAKEEERTLIRERIKTGNLEPVGGMYVQPEMQEPCGEALIQQLQTGQRWMEEHLGKRASCAWNIDAFGQINQLPQILLQSGIKHFVFMRDIDQRDDPAHFPSEFYYQGPDGSRILTHWLKNSYVLCESDRADCCLKVANVEVTPENERQILRQVFEGWINPDSLQRKTGLALVLWGDDMYSLKLTSVEIKEKILEAARLADIDLREEDLLLSTPSAFFEALEQQKAHLSVQNNNLNPPVYRQDLRGTYVSRIRHKLMNRKAEQALLSAEALLAAAGKEMPDTEELWKPVLFNQFHDTMGGSCVDEVYLSAMERYEAVIREAEERKRMALETCTSNAASAANVLNAVDAEHAPHVRQVCIYNPTSLCREDVVHLPLEPGRKGYGVKDQMGAERPSVYEKETGRLGFLVGKIGPYKVATYIVEEMAAEGTQMEAKTTETAAETAGISVEVSTAAKKQVLENAWYRLQADAATGNLLSIWDKEENRELLEGPGNVLVALEEKDPDMEGALCLTGQEYKEDEVPVTWLKTEHTKLAHSITSRKEWLGFGVEKQILLRNDCKRIEFITEILDYTGKDLMLNVSFPMKMEDARGIYETPFGMAQGREGLCCAQKWAALYEKDFSTAVLNQGTGACWIGKKELRLALLRGYENYTLYAKMGRDRGLSLFQDEKTHTEQAKELGDHRFCYALVSGKKDTAHITKQAILYNSPLEACFIETPVNIPSVVTPLSETFFLTKLIRRAPGRVVSAGVSGQRNRGCL